MTPVSSVEMEESRSWREDESEETDDEREDAAAMATICSCLILENKRIMIVG